MTFEAFLPHQLRPQIAMTDVRVSAMTMNARSIRQEYTYVVKQSRFFQKLFVQLQFGMTVGNPKCLVGHRATMRQQDMFQFIVLRIIFINKS